MCIHLHSKVGRLRHGLLHNPIILLISNLPCLFCNHRCDFVFNLFLARLLSLIMHDTKGVQTMWSVFHLAHYLNLNQTQASIATSLQQNKNSNLCISTSDDRVDVDCSLVCFLLCCWSKPWQLNVGTSVAWTKYILHYKLQVAFKVHAIFNDADTDDIDEYTCGRNNQRQQILIPTVGRLWRRRHVCGELAYWSGKLM